MPDETQPTADKPASGGLAKNAAITFVGTLASRLLGMFREVLIAVTFSTAVTDVFFVAWRVPNALRALLAEGAASAALGPAFSEAQRPEAGSNERNLPRLREVISRVGGAAFATLALATALGVIFARPIFSLVSKGFAGDVARFELGVLLLRLLFPFLFLMGWFAIGRTALERLGDFRTGSAASVLQNVAFVLAPFVLVPFAPWLGLPPIAMMAVAALLGGFLQAMYLRPALRRRGVLVRPTLARDPALREVSRTFATMLYGQAVYQINVVLASRLLSSLEPGSASWNSYAQRIADIPQGLFTVSIAGAAAAEMERYAVDNDRTNVGLTLERTISLSAFVALPACVLLAVYSEAVVPVIFGYGRFASGANAQRNLIEVARSLEWQALTVALFAFVHPMNRVFAAFKNRKPILIASTLALLAFGLVSGPLTVRYGHVGVAMAGAVSGAVQLVALAVQVRAQVPLEPWRMGGSLAKVLAATGVMALAARAAVQWLPVRESHASHKILAVVVGGALALLYVGAAWILQCNEINELRQKIARRRSRS
ncbi:MAG: murein biosynthesis integral membrane protein MurJ [Deltaproteobacteria bacterium]|nr:murein biosynthesis integral membrane protein MurJ [Deltaproteobacteria bacterium]